MRNENVLDLRSECNQNGWYGSDYKTAFSLKDHIPNLNITNIVGTKSKTHNYGKV